MKKLILTYCILASSCTYCMEQTLQERLDRLKTEYGSRPGCKKLIENAERGMQKYPHMAEVILENLERNISCDR